MDQVIDHKVKDLRRIPKPKNDTDTSNAENPNVDDINWEDLKNFDPSKFDPSKMNFDPS